jgi:SAM-dependent methyltransferase
MPAYYDKFDYPSYWIGRDYEHKSEVFALGEFLKIIPKIDTAVDIGCGFGRLIKSYSFRSKKIILVDPSSKLLKIARIEAKGKKYKFFHLKVENINKKIRKRSCDLVIFVRVIHHIENLETALLKINSILKTRGYLILEFPNKKHFKSALKEILSGNFTYLYDITPRERCTKNYELPHPPPRFRRGIPLGKFVRHFASSPPYRAGHSRASNKKTIPFRNYHPEYIVNLLQTHNFEIIEKRSVSNIRSKLLKKIFSTQILLLLEKPFQRILAPINFGPSIFILAQKTK